MTQLLRSLIRQVLLESDETYTPVAPHNAPLGKYAFANVRLGTPKPPPEEDTQTERYLYRSLISHFSSYQPISKFYADQILDFIEKDLYSDVFKAPIPSINLYRGLSISDRYVAEKFLPKGITFNDAWRQIIETGEDFASFKTQLDLTNINERYTASWTKSLKKAKEFAGGNSSDFAIIACATVNDSPGKWIDCSGLYRLNDFKNYNDENEVIAVDTIRVNEVMIRPSVVIGTEFEISQIMNLPKNRRITKGGLDLSGTDITSLPEGLVVKGDLYLSNAPITSLPEGLVVKGILSLGTTSIIILPEDLQVGVGIFGLKREYWENVPEHLKDKLR